MEKDDVTPGGEGGSHARWKSRESGLVEKDGSPQVEKKGVRPGGKYREAGQVRKKARAQRDRIQKTLKTNTKYH